MGTLARLKPNPKNPRVANDDRLSMLGKTLHEYGDLSGIVHNRATGHLVGGHQRLTRMKPDTPIHIQKRFEKPTRAGTVAVGYVLLDGERYSYREVHWPARKERGAMIAANRGAGDWDEALLGEHMRELEADYDFDLDLTLFDRDERATLLKVKKEFAGKDPKPDPDEPEEDGPKKRVECPDCGHRFTPGWS